METVARGVFYVLLGFVLPGLALPRALGIRIDPALILPVGGCVTACCYWFSIALGQAWLFPISMGVVALGLARPRPAPSLSESRESLPVAVLTLAAVVLVLGATVYPLHRVDADGEFLLDGETALAADTAFHVGVTRELAIGYPPQVPGISGFRLRYHLGTDLLRAAGQRWLGLDPYDAINRIDVTVWALALILAVRAAARQAGGSALAVALAGVTVLLADFSFLFAGNPQAHWWVDLLRGNVLLSLVYANPVVPGLALALGSLVALGHHRIEGGRGWLCLAVALAFAVAFFKVFLGAHLCAGLLAAAALCRDRRALAAGAAAAASTFWLALGSGDHGVSVSIAPLDLVDVTRETLALPALGGATRLGWALLWLMASVGLRWLGLVPAVQALRGGDAPVAALAVMALVGWPLGLIFKVAPPDAVAGQRPINDASFFVEQSGPLLWIFAALALARLAERRRLLVIGLAAAVSLPSTAHFVWKKSRQEPHPMPASTVRAMATLAAISAPGDVILQRPARLYPPAPVILIGRRVPYERFTPYLTQFAPKAALEQRHEQVFRFFERAEGVEARRIAEALGARYLCLYGHDRRPRFDLDALYERVYEEADVAVYRRRD